MAQRPENEPVPAQSTNHVLMVRPCHFYPNPETAADNAFQRANNTEPIALNIAARREFDTAVQTLRHAGVKVHVIEDTADPEKPDAVFPNNWISTHHDGRVALFPMYSALRRTERRFEVIDELRKYYRVTDVLDYSALEKDGTCLEGTGSLVLDHANKIAYVSLSNRSNLKAIRRFAGDFEYEPVIFTSIGLDGQPIYHTNVMMCIGTNFALVALAVIPNRAERNRVRESLNSSGKEIVELTSDQVANFAGNAIELKGNWGEKLLPISERAVAMFTEHQQAVLNSHVRLMPLHLPSIETGGGSARCMIAEIYLPPL